MKNIKLVAIPKTASTFVEMNFCGEHLINQFYIPWSELDTTPKEILFDGNLTTFQTMGHSWNYPTQIGGWQDWTGKNVSNYKFNDVGQFNITESDILFSIVRNPYDILFSIFNYNWGGCREFHGLDTEWEYSIEEFQKFVDIYLDKSKVFFAPSFRRSMFSQLKDINGNWLINGESIILRFENFDEEFENFRKRTNVELTNTFESKNKSLQTKPCEWYDAYRNDQIWKLKKLWKEDLDYFNYSHTKPKPKPKNPNRKLKIALCFSGHLRDIDSTKKYWTSLIDKYDIDVYGSFWDIENKNLNDTFVNFKGTYRPKRFQVESYKNFEQSTLTYLRHGITSPDNLHTFLRQSTSNFGFFPMWYQVWRANLLTKQVDIDYDIVIRARTDTSFEGLTIENNNYLNVPQGRVKTPLQHSEGVSDLFAYGRVDIMDYYSTCIFNVMDHVNKGFYLVPHEYFLRTHLEKTEMNIRFMAINTTITRKSKGTKDELFCNGKEMGEDIFPSDFFLNKQLEPNKDIIWKIDDKLKF